MPRLTLKNLDEILTYHSPNEEQQEHYEEINQAAKDFAAVILEHAPDSRERSVALTHLQDARMWANSAVALEHIKD